MFQSIYYSLVSGNFKGNLITMTGPIKVFIYGEAQKLKPLTRSVSESYILNFR